MSGAVEVLLLFPEGVSNVAVDDEAGMSLSLSVLQSDSSLQQRKWE